MRHRVVSTSGGSKIVTLPPEILACLNIKPGDRIEFIPHRNGTATIKKKKEEQVVSQKQSID
ncbi:AbrB/MazE/SpoVT family DNA-binding domain-containing protein [Vagococcus sp. BWB3-3]|uniref:AbrB/MazE/SpoVT family DNA-binding domain-containing protein n=1 Tax=Vagococcus allomyrinae TaxID=2794353 RepID=A0A940SSW3_9ENTE|nr:AbrB/MazE/SpoVT family DNA-binding domain-containing protein [Vagococcus allomyrinae]MBP1039675.1 AbrB/MazE/SpoVT family DNA-binding domain-containing protein [Vagococcus allomyrinae]